MADRFDIETLVKKVGGSFSLTVLVQKRLKELKSGVPRLVDLKPDNLLEVACQEIIEDKISLVPEEPKMVPPVAVEDVHEIFGTSKPKEKKNIFQG